MIANPRRWKFKDFENILLFRIFHSDNSWTLTRLSVFQMSHAILSESFELKFHNISNKKPKFKF